MKKTIVITGIFILALFLFFYIPKIGLNNKKADELSRVRKELIISKKDARDLDKFRAKVKKAEAEFIRVNRALPRKADLDILLSGIHSIAKESDIHLLSYEPKSERKRDFYAEIPVSLKVTGYTHNLGIFIDKLSRLPRVVQVDKMKITSPPSSRKVVASFDLKAYRFLEPTRKKKKR